jgi:Repeat of unknown function (DUF5650)
MHIYQHRKTTNTFRYRSLGDNAMHRTVSIRPAKRGLATCLIVFAALSVATSTHAGQINIQGPTGSVSFGYRVAVLPNGNIVVTDPGFDSPTANSVGAVYLCSPAGALISSFTGSTTNDDVGDGGIVALSNGNFVILSPNWHGNKGAATWVSGSQGLSGTVSSANSLVGTAANSYVGGFVTVLSNGNYVVSSPNWNGNAGAATWAKGSTGLVGSVSTANSLVGATANDYVGSGVTALSNGNYVVASSNWTNGTFANAGEVTWADGSTGLVGNVSAANSLVGTAANEYVGYSVTALKNNGNYVVVSPNWINGSMANAGAVTWADGSAGLSGGVSASNSLYGTAANEYVGSVTALSNGNYVVSTPDWNGNHGAATWASGSTGLVGAVSGTNSLVGSSASDDVASLGVTALTNGNYVVVSPNWNSVAGAATWADGNTGLTGSVSTSNSLVGTASNDAVGSQGVTALSNGNYVVASTAWTNGTFANAGEATWADGSTGLVGSVSAANSLVGTATSDYVGYSVIALSNGNYVVVSPNWSNGSAVNAGAVTWANGSTGLAGGVSTSNSLYGTAANEYVGVVTALSNGNYVVASPNWSNGSLANAGAVTWANGSNALVGAVSAANSLVGTAANDYVGLTVTALSNGNYAVLSPSWSSKGAVSLGLGTGGTVGAILATNSVLGTVTGGGSSIVFAYNASRDQLVVGQPAGNVVSLFQADSIFTNSFELQ